MLQTGLTLKRSLPGFLVGQTLEFLLRENRVSAGVGKDERRNGNF